jgi:hypothetical protein
MTTVPATESPGVNLNTSLGMLEVGVLISTFAFGIVSVPRTLFCDASLIALQSSPAKHIRITSNLERISSFCGCWSLWYGESRVIYVTFSQLIRSDASGS